MVKTKRTPVRRESGLGQSQPQPQTDHVNVPAMSSTSSQSQSQSQSQKRIKTEHPRGASNSIANSITNTNRTNENSLLRDVTASDEQVKVKDEEDNQNQQHENVNGYSHHHRHQHPAAYNMNIHVRVYANENGDSKTNENRSTNSGRGRTHPAMMGNVHVDAASSSSSSRNRAIRKGRGHAPRRPFASSSSSSSSSDSEDDDSFGRTKSSTAKAKEKPVAQRKTRETRGGLKKDSDFSSSSSSSSSGNSDDPEYSNNFPSESEEDKKPTKTSNKTQSAQERGRNGYASATKEVIEEINVVDEVLPPGNKIFYNHNCDDKTLARFYNQMFSCGNTGNDDIWHKGCCHRIYGPDEDTLSPMQQAIEDALEEETIVMEELRECVIMEKYKFAQREQKRYEEEYELASGSLIHTNQNYTSAIEKFHLRPKQKKWVVLDLFSGIGSGIVALKRLKLRIKTVVHVEHDPIANFVNEYNHSDDGIKHVFLKKFEDIFHPKSDKDLKELISDHGPFDIVLAGAPCGEYSPVNAQRKGTSSEASGRYLTSVGKLITKMNKIQCSQVLFLSENVVFNNEEWHRQIQKCYGGIGPVNIDAKFFSPCRRNRLYWTNMPVEKTYGSEDEEYLRSNASDAMDPGYIMPEMIPMIRGLGTDERIIKANTFMAAQGRYDAQGRLDDDRMMKVRKIGRDKYAAATFSARERELMLGLPLGYVTEPLKELFQILTEKAFQLPETNREHKAWKDYLPRSYWKFAKECSFEFKPSPGVSPFFHIEISAPTENEQKPYYFNEEGYAKHLLGNGWSIPVIEHLLKPLTKKCSKTKHYDGYEYVFQWEPHLEKANQTRFVDEADV